MTDRSRPREAGAGVDDRAERLARLAARDPRSPRPRRDHPAGRSRAIATGLSMAALSGLVTTLALSDRSAAGSDTGATTAVVAPATEGGAAPISSAVPDRALQPSGLAGPPGSAADAAAGPGPAPAVVVVVRRSAGPGGETVETTEQVVTAEDGRIVVPLDGTGAGSSPRVEPAAPGAVQDLPAQPVPVRVVPAARPPAPVVVAAAPTSPPVAVSRGSR